MEDFIKGFGITPTTLAVAIGVPPRRINEIVHGKRGISADTAVRLAKYFGTSAEVWMNVQAHDELRIERASVRPSVPCDGAPGPWVACDPSSTSTAEPPTESH